MKTIIYIVIFLLGTVSCTVKIDNVPTDKTMLSLNEESGVSTVNGNGTSITANPNATQDAQAVLSYLYSLKGRNQNKVISGEKVAEGINEIIDVTQIHADTGHWSAMIGAEYYQCCYSKVSPPPKPSCYPNCVPICSKANQMLIDYWNKGGLVTINLHPFNPTTLNVVNDKNANRIDIVTPGTPSYNVWMNQLNLLADCLQELEDAGVVVLWRPFHEYFWWGTGVYYQNIWKQMFNYFTYDRGLDNLLWVFSPSWEYNEGVISGTYPGDQYVDIAAMDIYTDSIEVENRFFRSTYNSLVATGKPVAFGEFGPKTLNPKYDYYNLIDAIKTLYPETVMYMTWHGRWSLANHLGAQEMFDDPWVIDRDDLINDPDQNWYNNLPDNVLSAPLSLSIIN